MNERELFQEALDRADAAQRQTFLDKACAGDAALRARIEALLTSHASQSQFLNVPFLEQLRPSAAGNDSTVAADASKEDNFMVDETKDDEKALGFLAPATRPDSLGRIGHYEVLQLLGKGAFGIVFRAFDDVLHRVVAVKVLSPQMAATSPARKRFLREARTSAQVRHENVVQVYEVGEQPLPYIVMEFIPGETLQQRLDRIGPVDVAEVVRIGRQIAEGLAAAHATDLIHRDIKPGNILLEGGAQRVKITDFGLARAADDASISQSGIIAGTPMYMAPEQAKGETLDQRADLFSLGSVLYQMASGRAPFRATGTLAVLKRVTEDTPRPIREVIPETPQWLCDIITKLHAKNPNERYQSAREVTDVLADCEAQLKANSKLKDFSRIPQRALPKVGFGKRVIVSSFIVLCFVGLVAIVAGLYFNKPESMPKDDSASAVPVSPTPPIQVVTQGPTFKNSIGMEFVIVPKGKSWLGGGKDKLGDKEVEFPADFYLGKYEVTQEEWEMVMGEKPSHFSRTGEGKDKVKDIPDEDLKRFPVERVSWDDCQTFVAKLNEREKEKGWVYRLPKEAEWEYACRGGPMSDKRDSAFDFYFAKPTSAPLPQQANFGGDKGLNRTCQVGLYEANRLGLFDMQGNVCEWCADDAQPDLGVRVHRGLGWNVGTEYFLANPRGEGPPPAWRHFAVGLRLARVPSGAPSPETKTPPAAVAPFTDADVKRIAALPAEQQVEEVRKELVRRNPGFDGKVEHKIEDGVVTELRIVTDQVTDVAPVRVFNALRVLDLNATHTDYKGNGQLADLSPLAGMNRAGLTRLNLSFTKVGDAGLVHFKDCTKLAYLNLDSTPVSDAGLTYFKDRPNLSQLLLGRTKITDAGLTHFNDCKKLILLDLSELSVGDAGLGYFNGCEHLNRLVLGRTLVTDAGLAHFKVCKKLQYLSLHETQVGNAGLAHFKDCKKLTQLSVSNTQVTDLSLLNGMPLKELFLNFRPDRDAEIHRSIKTLETINGKSAAEFWERYDKGDFKECLSLRPSA